MLENLHKISLRSIEKAPVTQPNIYSLDVGCYPETNVKVTKVYNVLTSNFELLQSCSPLSHTDAQYLI